MIHNYRWRLTLESDEVPVSKSIIARGTVVTLLASLLAGCAVDWRSSTYDPRRACEVWSGGYSERDGTCRYGGP